MLANSLRKGFIWSAPKEQLSPTEKMGYELILARNPSMVCPLRVRPAKSLTVILSMMGSSTPCICISVMVASMAALALSVSNMVSIKMASTPPSISAPTCSR